MEELPTDATFDLVIFDGYQYEPAVFDLLHAGTAVFVEGKRQRTRDELAVYARRKGPDLDLHEHKGNWYVGPGGQGSSFGPALANSLKTVDYNHFASIVANGRKSVNAAQDLVMPAFGANKNVMCFLDAIYVYLRARSAGATGPERPNKHEPKPPEFAEQEDACMR